MRKRRIWAAAGVGAILLFLISIAIWNLSRDPEPTQIRTLIQSAAQIDQAVKQGSVAEIPEADPAPRYPYTNRLSREASPYLQMHAHNPVDWYPWGEEAFRKARAEKKPIFLSVGYAACHWCGVMERESFSDPKIADIMNRHYVSIKLDREERPDIDRVYLTFMQLTTGGSGYPMTLFLTPDLQPILGGTYFPKEPQNGLPGFGTFLTQFAGAWENDRENVLKSASSVTDSLRGYIRDQAASGAKPDDAIFEQTYNRIRAQYDKINGGFGDKPKYPQPVNFN